MDPVIPSRFLPVIQLAISPMILMTGVGGLMLTLTNRMARIVDRTRSLAEKVRGSAGPERTHLEMQLGIMWSRAKLIRQAVTLAGLSMLMACLLVVMVFIDASVQREFGLELVGTFLASILSLIAALVTFLRDIWLSPHALKLEVDRTQRPAGSAAA